MTEDGIIKIAESKTYCPCCRVSRKKNTTEVRAVKSDILTALGELSLKLFHYCVHCDSIFFFEYYDYLYVLKLAGKK